MLEACKHQGEEWVGHPSMAYLLASVEGLCATVNRSACCHPGELVLLSRFNTVELDVEGDLTKDIDGTPGGNHIDVSRHTPKEQVLSSCHTSAYATNLEVHGALSVR